VTFVGFAVFLLFGVCLVLLGANQETLAADLGLDFTRLGMLGSALALGIGVGVAGAGPIVDRSPRKPLFVASALLAAAALWWVEPGMAFARVLAQLSVVGIAIGVQETLVNTCIAQRYKVAAAKPLIVVHAGATLGAALTPLAIASLLPHPSWIDVFRATGAGQLALALACLCLRFPDPLPQHERAARGPLPWCALAPFLWISFAYVGVETTLSLYVLPYAHSIGVAETRALRAMTFFWGGLLAGRVMLLLVRQRIGARYLAGAGLAGACVIGIGIGGGLDAIEAVYGLTGLGMGFVFPVLIALASERAPAARGTATGLAAGAGAFGGLAIPPLHGLLGDHFGVSAALLALVFWCAVMALASLAAMRHERAHPPQRSQR
jgi:fucose permease